MKNNRDVIQLNACLDYQLTDLSDYAYISFEPTTVDPSWGSIPN